MAHWRTPTATAAADLSTGKRLSHPAARAGRPAHTTWPDTDSHSTLGNTRLARYALRRRRVARSRCPFSRCPRPLAGAGGTYPSAAGQLQMSSRRRRVADEASAAESSPAPARLPGTRLTGSSLNDPGASPTCSRCYSGVTRAASPGTRPAAWAQDRPRTLSPRRSSRPSGSAAVTT